MNESSKNFKVALVGGFQREDVLQYIEGLSRNSAEQLRTVQAENEALREEHDELTKRNEAISQKNADLLERLGEMTMESERLQTAAEARTREMQAAADELCSLRARMESLAAEKAALTAENEELRQRCEEYTASKEGLAEMELSAHRRAKEVESRAQYEARRVRTQSAEVVSALKKEVEAVGEAYRQSAEQAKLVAAENARRAQQLQETLDGVVAMLDEVVVGELAVGQPDSADRPLVQRVLDMICKKEEE